MAPTKAFRWPDNKQDIALATEVAAFSPVKPKDWEAIAARLSKMFTTESTQVELKGRGCRERLERLIDKFKAEDAKALKGFTNNSLMHLCIRIKMVKIF